MLFDHTGHPMGVDRLEPGDVLLTLFDPLMIWSYPIWLATKSKYIHSTVYIGDGLEWSIDWRGSMLRPVGTDRFQHAFRPKDFGAAQRVAEFARSVEAITYGYNLEGAVWQGLQALGGIQNRTPLPWKTKAKFCSEGTTDIFVYENYDIVPHLETGTVLPGDLASPKALVYQI